MLRPYCLLLLLAALAPSGCGTRIAGRVYIAPAAPPDAGEDGPSVEVAPDRCGDAVADPACEGVSQGPPDAPFPLESDQERDPFERDDGVKRDGSGWLILDGEHSASRYLWIANSEDNNAAGTVSKIDSRKVREVARYPTVTCSSLPDGGVEPCDGARGCCAIDDWYRYQARRNGQVAPPHQQVQRHDNYPSRTAVDFNGDLFIANRAFGGQSSVTRIANDKADCVDRNHDGVIQTSRDSNGNGYIEVDCNGNGIHDDLEDVQKLGCTNRLQQEYYGNDDECVLWTANTFVTASTGRPLALSAGLEDAAASDAWAGSFVLGRFVRIDGRSGLAKDEAQLPAACYGKNGPYGLAVDGQGIGWTANMWYGKLCYFDTRNPTSVGVVRDPQWGPVMSYGIAVDRDQNVWLGADVARYTPDRTNGFRNLGNGWWTKVDVGVGGGLGVAADSRSADAYFVYACLGDRVLQIPGSTIANVNHDQTVTANAWPRIRMPCYGVAVDLDQNVWGADMVLTTRALVDAAGRITQPSVNGHPLGNDRCPAGDSCPNAGAYTYSDFSGFGLRNFTRPQGRYQVLVRGCADAGGRPRDTQWFQIKWDAEQPPNTALVVHARSGASPDLADPSWSARTFTPDTNTSPLDLQQLLVPNVTPTMHDPPTNDGFLLLEFVFKTVSPSATPRLKSFEVGFKCNSIG